jgi:two-component system chemotaxis response regulator CheB
MSAASPLVRILIVDDSAVMRSLLRSVVHTDKRLEVVGTAADGASALRAIDSLRPDLVLLDVEMPGMDGLSTLKQIKASYRRIPVIMCSSITQRGAKVTIEALASGAADYVAKPSGQVSRDAAIQTLAHDLVPKILAFTATSVHSAPPLQPRGLTIGVGFHSAAPAAPALSPLVHTAPLAPAAPPSVVVIGVSTGGPAALDVLLPALPSTFPLPVLVVQHMPELFTALLAERLNSRCALRVCEPKSGDPVRCGTIYIARGDWHLTLVHLGPVAFPGSAATNSPQVIRLTQEAPENHCRPSVDVLFRTAVAAYGSRVLGVILTGMGSDGLAGCRLIREHNGTVLAQDQQTSAVWGMPGAVAHAGLVHRILPLGAIAPEILRLAGRGQREAFELRESAVSL